MTTLERLISSENFDKVVISICFWVVLYIIVKICTVRAGVGDLLNQAYKRTGRLRKYCLQLRMLCLSQNAASHLSRSIAVLKHVIKAQKRASKVMTMYLFDDRGDLDVAAAKALVDHVPDLCRDAIVKVAENGEADIKAIFDNIEENIKTAKELLKKAAAIDRKKELLQI
ncbi:MAG: hypothetical protein IKS77_07045 [Spirochaetales bacterium]|nr:hypothetical protein [Spirochaetales bacterium]